MPQDRDTIGLVFGWLHLALVPRGSIRAFVIWVGQHEGEWTGRGHSFISETIVSVTFPGVGRSPAESAIDSKIDATAVCTLESLTDVITSVQPDRRRKQQ